VVFPAALTKGNGALSRYDSPAATAYVRRFLRGGRADAVHVEGFYLAHLVPQQGSVPLLLVEQNVEYSLWRQRLNAARSLRGRLDAACTYRRIRAAERAAWRRSTMVGTVTTDDRASILASLPGLDVRVIPDGADHLQDKGATAPPEPGTVVMVANYAYQPNADGARWFCDEVLPRVSSRVGNVKVMLVGNEPAAELLALQGDRLIVTGRVPRVDPYLDRAAVVVCPLRIGGGIKVKLLEALARGKAVVTTTIGTQGFGGDIREAVCVADSAADFSGAVSRLLERPADRARLEAAATSFARRLPTWDQAAEALLDCYGELTAAEATRRPPRSYALPAWSPAGGVEVVGPALRPAPVGSDISCDLE
jgi:glycosyltransferase involved in cell wall biosynthesis